MVYDTWDYEVLGFYPLFSILKNTTFRKLDIFCPQVRGYETPTQLSLLESD
jgi:hypothetical protein